ncbi:hypothetical protein [Xanthomonas axonopodis]
MNEQFGNFEQLARADAAGGLNEQSGNSGQLQGEQQGAGDALNQAAEAAYKVLQATGHLCGGDPFDNATEDDKAAMRRVAAAALAARLPVESLPYVPGKLDHSAPTRIWLQIDTAADNAERNDSWPGSQHITWQDESMGGLEIEYVRADVAARQPVGQETRRHDQSAEDRFEQFVQAEIARSPNALRELGEYLGRVLDEDDFPAANRLLLQIATEHAAPPAPAGVPDSTDITDDQIDARLNGLYRTLRDNGTHNGGMVGVAWDRAVYRMAAAPAAVPVDGEGWSGWATQYPGKMPVLHGAREIAELNYYPEEGQRLLYLATHPQPAAAMTDEQGRPLTFWGGKAAKDGDA